jgi:hypothetical protein
MNTLSPWASYRQQALGEQDTSQGMLACQLHTTTEPRLPVNRKV